MNLFPTRSPLPAILALSACLAGAPAPAAGTPTTGVLHFTSLKRQTNVYKLDFAFDGTSILEVQAPSDIASLTLPMGIAKVKNGKLVIASTADSVYLVDPRSGSVSSVSVPDAAPRNIALTASETVAWATNDRGELYRIPVDPLGAPVLTPVTGADNTIHQLYFIDEHTAYYATRQPFFGQTIYVGVLDTRTMRTTRWLETPGSSVGLVFDPFTNNLVICGSHTLTQVDVITQKVVSSTVRREEYSYLSCAVDGEGHLFVTDFKGKLSFFDYSESRDITRADNPWFEKENLGPMNMLAPLSGPGSVRVKPPPMQGFKAAYIDGDGDGRIDGAVLEMPRFSVIRPSRISFRDPIGGAVRVLEEAALEPISPSRFRIAFPDTPMTFGTTFAPGPYASILGDTAFFDPAPFVVRDSVGPQLLAAESAPPQRAGQKPFLTVSFSEPIRMASVSGALPFRVMRDGVDVAPQMQLRAATHLDSNTWKFEFASADFPKGGDSLVVIPGTPQLTDTLRNLSNQTRLVPIHGLAPPVFSVMAPAFTPVADFAVPAGAPPVRALLAADTAQPDACLNCPPGTVQQGMQAALQTPSRPGFQAWLFTVQTLGPVRYDLAIYNNLGEYVGRVQGTVDQATLARTVKDKEGMSHVRLYWWPVAESGSQARMGAYIARGFFAAEPMTLPSSTRPGTVLSLPGKMERVSLSFGRL